jgi:hypothetical protein
MRVHQAQRRLLMPKMVQTTWVATSQSTIQDKNPKHQMIEMVVMKKQTQFLLETLASTHQRIQ